MNTISSTDTRPHELGPATPEARNADVTGAASEHPPEVLSTIAAETTILGRTVAIAILLGFVLIPFAPKIVTFSALLILHTLAVITAAQLARSMNRSPILWAMLIIVPPINVFAAIRLTHLATVILRRHSIRCNDLGVSRREMQKYGCPNENCPVTVWKSKINS